MPDHPIHAAARRGDLAEVQRLIVENPALMELRGDVIYSGNSYQSCTPLLIASIRGHLEMVQWLLDQGADRDARATYGQDALYLASIGDHTAIVSLLLDRGMDINTANDEGWVPMTKAASE